MRNNPRLRKLHRRDFLQSVTGCALPATAALMYRNSPDTHPKNTGIIEHPFWRGELSNSGRFKSLEYLRSGQWQRVPFRSDKFAGPAWYGEWDGKTQVVNLRPSKEGYQSTVGGITFSLSYRAEKDRLAILATLRNQGSSSWRPSKAGLQLGIDTYMVKYPDCWDENLFPSLLRCEKTHFWGYFMSPRGQILGLASPDPLASWSLSYEELAHRIFTANLDFLNAGRLPERHPPDLAELRQNQTKSWTIYLIPVDDLASLKPALAEACMAPMLKLDRHTLASGEAGSEYSRVVKGKSGSCSSISARKVDYAFGRWDPAACA